MDLRCAVSFAPPLSFELFYLRVRGLGTDIDILASSLDTFIRRRL